jgi:hypothetical protein
MLTSLALSRVYAINNLGASLIMVVPANPSRNSLTFHNPGQQNVAVFPQYVLVNGQNVLLTPSLSALGGGFVLQFAATLFIGGSSAKMQWNALALAGSGNPLTASEE